MSRRPCVTTILPCTDLASAIRFFVRLGFATPSEEEVHKWHRYRMLSHPNGSEIHLRELGPGEEGWLEPFKNPFGIYVYSEDVEAIAVEFADEIIGSVKMPEIKEWGMFEFSLNGPDGCLVRVGWPAEGTQMSKKKAGEGSV
jgi:hypothetical protein